MNFIQLKYFNEVCKWQSISKAAAALHVSQPTISIAIKEFEKETGLNLFRRIGKRLLLTDDGHIVWQKIIPFLITVLIAIGMHHSAFVLFLMYPFYHLRLKKVTLIFIIPLTLVIYIYNKTIFVFLSNIINQMSDGQYEAEISSTGAFTMIVLLILFLALSYFLPDETLIDDETLGLRNLLIVALWFQFFAPLHSLAMRFNYYYIIFFPRLIPRIIQHSKVKYRKIGKMAEIVITVYFLYYYLSHTYSACVSGISALDTYPYVPFWKN